MATSKNDDGNATLVQDLKVTVQRFSKVFPANKWERDMFVSNIDLAANFNTGVINFFLPNSAFPMDSVIEKIEKTLQDVLVKYDYFAGRLKRDPHTNRLVIVCNAGWMGFAVATIALEDISSPDDQPLCAFQYMQVTIFKCGGFTMGYSANHMLSDGIGLRVFFENVAALLADKPIPFPPYNNRRALAARTPPRVKFSHNDILKLKKEAKMSTVEGTDIITSFNAVMAHLWRCRGSLSENDPEKKTSTILYAVDLRSRLQPPLPLTYAGNAIISAYATASISELKEKPLGYLVQLISQGTTRITNEYARSHIDWLELHTGFPHGDFSVSMVENRIC
ncbi:hypothetical protein AQUCO_01300861v1 [Aquilegia coerulea]|uniref:Uncharacterized protein n=1 Tax=Aquilegia coerulea TaxID=218851 RepID=A0A2G5E3S9_AQUCA|nr:hypothetical protein AQUCO_01300861v1 [Aquilegia coerulea]